MSEPVGPGDGVPSPNSDNSNNSNSNTPNTAQPLIQHHSSSSSHSSQAQPQQHHQQAQHSGTQHSNKPGGKHSIRHTFFTGRLRELFAERQTQVPAEKAEEVVVELYYYSASHLERKSTSNLDDLVAEPPPWASVAWINVDGLSETIIKKLATEFDLHPIAVEDVVEIQHRPKLDIFGNSLFLITSIISKESVKGKQNLTTEQVSFFLIGRTLITIQQGLPGDVWESVRNTILDQDSLTRNSDAGFLLYALLAGIVDTCKPIIDELEDTLEDLEVAMMEFPSHKLNKMVYAVKRHQITLRSTLFPTRKVAKYISEVTATYFRDLQGVLTHLCEQIEQQKEVANSLNSLHVAHQAQRQGTASYVIAIVSVFFLPLTFVAGVYGMNFVNMPELQWHYGYLYVWMIFIGVVLFEMLLFHQVGWIEFKISKRLAAILGRKRKAGTLPKKYYRSKSLIMADSDSATDTM